MAGAGQVRPITEKRCRTMRALPPGDERPTVAAIRSAGRAQVVVIGGGINGIATFRDLALQGVDVTLVERGDFASGATAASSHMIHGGIRYLENGEFRLVRESVQERNDLLRTAPHVVRPLQTTIPIYSTFSGILSAPLRFLSHRAGKPTERGALLIKVGLMIYDTFSRDGGSVPRHAFHRRRRSLELLPDLDPKVAYTATYYDASLRDPERLALDVLLDGLAAHPGARAANYVEAIGMDEAGVRVRDRESGSEFSIAAEVVVNTSGAWTDLTNGALGQPTTFMGGTKGSHIVLDHPQLLEATRGREIFFEHSDGRIVLIYPLKGRVLVGTTDLPAEPSQPVICTEEEVDYFFDLIKHVFPAIDVSREQIVYRYSGIRPLPRHEDTAPGFVSRDYRVEVDRVASHPAVVSLVGGKWTTFRAIGEAVADRVLSLLSSRRTRSTARLEIGGGKQFPHGEHERGQWLSRHLPRQVTRRQEVLFERYGTRAAAVAAFLEAGADDSLLDDELSTRELSWMVRREHVTHLSDVVFRRTDFAFLGQADRHRLEVIGAHLAPLLGWDDVRLDAEIEACADELPDEARRLAHPDFS